MQVDEPGADPTEGEGREDSLRINMLGGVASVVFVGGHIALAEVLGNHVIQSVSLLGVLTFLIVGVALHELLHGVGFRLGGIPWSRIRFGFMWKSLMPFAGCSDPMPVERYRFAILLPGWVTGFAPWIVGGALGNHTLAVAGALLTAGAVGDWLVWDRARRFPRGTMVQDLKSEIGFKILGSEGRIDE